MWAISVRRDVSCVVSVSPGFALGTGTEDRRLRVEASNEA